MSHVVAGPSAEESKVKTKGIHHIAFATKDTKATYDFYHNKLGMPLIHTENHKMEKGYFRHFFFDMGNDQCIGFFEVNEVGEKADFKTDISVGLGLPLWVNHIAFKVSSKEEYLVLKKRAKQRKVPIVAEIDHDWCFSLYFVDPNGIMLEYSYDVDGEEFVQQHDEAYRLLFDVPGEQIGDDTRKTKVDKDVK